jgi:hypothetical protein
MLNIKEEKMEQNNIQYAFPDEGNFDMTLRDYFAAKAMAVLMTSAWSIPHAEVANKAYWFAEQMMKAREQE